MSFCGSLNQMIFSKATCKHDVSVNNRLLYTFLENNVGVLFVGLIWVTLEWWGSSIVLRLRHQYYWRWFDWSIQPNKFCCCILIRYSWTCLSGLVNQRYYFEHDDFLIEIIWSVLFKKLNNFDYPLKIDPER